MLSSWWSAYGRHLESMKPYGRKSRVTENAFGPRDSHTLPCFAEEKEMDGNICIGIWRNEASSEFLCPLETTKQSQYGKKAEETCTTFMG